MTSIQLTLTGAQAKAEVDGILTSGMVGVPVSIIWDESWNGLVKTLVCRSDGCVRTSLNVGHQATVAPEVLRTERWSPNSLYLGVEGRDAEGNLVIPSTFAYCGQILPGAVTEGTISEEPENPAWAQILGLIGDMGALATSQSETLVSAINEAAGQGGQGTAEMTISAVYQLSSSCSEIPTGSWSASIPEMAAGKYLWTKITLGRKNGVSTSVYSVSGGVNSVNGVAPDGKGNVPLTAEDVGALPSTGGDLTGELRMNGQSVSGLNPPTENTQAANKGYVDTQVSQAAPVNLLDNSDFTNLVAQAGVGKAHGSQAYAADRWILDNGSVTYTKGTGLTLNGTIRQKLEKAPSVGSVFVETVSGTAEISYSSGAVTVTSDGGVLKWAALYEGEYTAEALPEYRPKGYTNELLECKRYFQRISGGVAAGYITAAGDVGMFLPMDVPTRIKPTVTMLIDSYAYFGNGLAEKVTEITPVLHTNGILLTGKLGYAPGSLAPATCPDLNMNLSADL